MKNLLNLGTVLNKTEQKNVFGGARIKHFPGEGNECIEGMCANMPNPEYDLSCLEHNSCPPAFVAGVCRDGECYYS